MILKKLNKRRTRLIVIYKYIFVLIIITSAVLLFYNIYSSNIFNKRIINFIEKVSFENEFYLKQVKINDLKQINKLEVEKYFNEYYGKSIFLIPINKIAKLILENNWIDNVVMKNDFKNTISINISEVIPKGIYYDEKNYFLFDREGKILELIDLKNFTSLKLIKFRGENSLNNANFFLDSIPSKFIRSIKEAVFIGNRRWDIKLINDINLKLAENKILESINNYNKIYMQMSNQELNNIKSIDLRMPKKAVIKMRKLND